MTDQHQSKNEIQFKNPKASRIFFLFGIAATAISLSACGKHDSPPSNGEMSSAQESAAEQALANNINAGNAWMEAHYGSGAKGSNNNAVAKSSSSANGAVSAQRKN